MSLRSDCLIATVGIFPKKVTDANLATAAKLTDKWEKKIAALVGGEREKWEYREPPENLDEIFRVCASPINSTELAALMHPFSADAEMTAGFATSLNAGRAFLKDRWPACTIRTEAGPQVTELAPGEDMQIGGLYYVLTDTEKTLFAELSQCSIEPGQVDAFKAAMPDLHQWCLQSIERAKVPHVAKDRSWTPDHDISGALRILQGLPPEVPFVPPTVQPVIPTKYQADSEKVATAEDLTTQPIGRDDPTGH